jgi:hypothetical protein
MPYLMTKIVQITPRTIRKIFFFGFIGAGFREVASDATATVEGEDGFGGCCDFSWFMRL